MEILKIPLYKNLLKYTQKVRIDGIAYLLSFRYQRRSDRWYMSIATEDNTPIQTGIRCITGQLLFNPYENLPKGQFMFVRNDSKDDDANLDDFGVLAWLSYIPYDIMPVSQDTALTGLTFSE